MGKSSVHDDVLELLPWFVSESLGERERQRVLAHLRDCPDCRRERDELQALQQIVADDDGSVDADYRPAFRRLMERIDATEAMRASTRDFETGSGSRGFAPYLAAAASVLVAVLVVTAISGGGDRAAEEDFRTLFTPASPTAEGIPHRVTLRFDQPLSPDALRRTLIDTRSTIISGPDETGTYIVELRIPSHLTDLEFIESVRGIEGVRHAAYYANDLDR